MQRMCTMKQKALTACWIMICALTCKGWSQLQVEPHVIYHNDCAAEEDDVIAYCLQDLSAYPQHQVYTIRINGTGNARLIPDTFDLNHFNYSNDGRYLATTGYLGGMNGTWSVFTYCFSTATLQRLTTTPAVWDGDPAYAPDDSLLVFTRTYPLQGGRNEIWMLNSDGTNLHYTGIQGFQPKFSPEGRRLAYASNVSGGWEIYICAVDGGSIRRLTDNTSDDFAPGWSPDGARIVFHSDRDGNYEIYTMDTLGVQVRRLTENPASDAQAKWSPDGTHIAFHSDRLGAGRYQVFVMDSNGSNVGQVTDAVFPAEAINPSWKPRAVTSRDEEKKGQTPQQLELYHNYPNPFNPGTTLRYSLPNRAFATLTVYNALGQQVVQLVRKQLEAGYHEAVFRGEGLSSGLYFYQLRAGDQVETKTMILIK